MADNESMTYYSQHGEDSLFEAAFQGEGAGFFVEVGCIDGRRFSNTLMLEEQGWTGLCFEAHPDYIEAIRRNRPGSRVIHAAVSDQDKDSVPFYANSRAALSSLDKSMESRFTRDYAPWFSGFVEKQVPMRSLNSIFREQGISRVDVLSIDVDGTDTDVVRGIDLNHCRPGLIVIECDLPNGEADVDELLVPAGYLKGPNVDGNQFYFDGPQRLNRIGNRRFAGTLVHTQHPLDSCGDQRVRFLIQT